MPSGRVPRVGLVAVPSQKQPYRVTFVLDLFNGPDERPLSREVLNEMLRCLFTIDVLYLRTHPQAPWLYQSGVRYMEEPVGQEEWQDIPTCIRIGTLDCEDAACWRAAELVVRQKVNARPKFIEQKRRDGSYLYHIIVELPDGRTEDPSRVLGMR